MYVGRKLAIKDFFLACLVDGGCGSGKYTEVDEDLSRIIRCAMEACRPIQLRPKASTSRSNEAPFRTSRATHVAEGAVFFFSSKSSASTMSRASLSASRLELDLMGVPLNVGAMLDGGGVEGLRSAIRLKTVA
jgi:hypothetical protein